MRPKSVKPSAYPPVPFHIIRGLNLLSALVVASILAVFISNLSKDHYKLPWAFLVLLISSLLSLINFVLTTITHCCYGLSPLLSATTHSILLLLWLISLGLMSWSMSHTILTTCNATYWGTSTGINVCRLYKALFSFTVLSVASHLFGLTLDVIVRRRQTRLGTYDPMASSTHLNNYKMHDRSSSVMSGSVGPYGPYVPEEDQHPLFRRHQHQPSEDEYYNNIPDPTMSNTNTNTQRMPPPVYGANSSLEHYHVDDAQEYSDTAPALSQRRTPRVRFSGYGGYNHPAEQTDYDPAAYR
ncbi:hypothetical protein EYZ11_009932 [Aspergillus tanneri]|uniref:MARVEL domain-containing protein n=1 Tax=Aspergillus tanneri TaxID=1220188 RepID=A0A4S3J6T6_9EURO|nr:hypothetical protein EYZ11_009932 [Aspergillus tanneri]